MPCPLSICLSIFRDVPCQNFWYVAMTGGGRLYEFQLSTNMRQQQFDFWNAACSYLRNSWVTSLTDSSQSLARSAKILCSGSKTMAINMGIHFEDLAIDVQRFLTLVCLSRILPLLLATSLFVIWFQATYVSLGDWASGTFGLLSVPPSLASNCPLSRDLLRPCTLLGGEGTVSGTRGNIWWIAGIPFS
jgi:hypothetical protein